MVIETPGVGFASRSGRRAGHAARGSLARSGRWASVFLLSGVKRTEISGPQIVRSQPGADLSKQRICFYINLCQRPVD
jgi:hypothetical protein